LGLTWDPLKDLLGLGKYLMRSPTGEVIFGGETMRFSKMVGRTGLKYIYINIYYRLAGFYAKKTKRDWISTHKEGRLDTFDRVVFLVEMGWCSNSRNAV
jgi:hypothetical protein